MKYSLPEDGSFYNACVKILFYVKDFFCSYNSEAYSEPCQASKMKVFQNTVHDWMALTVSSKSSLKCLTSFSLHLFKS